ncbi:MAG: HlyD family efflux transporter periplasmic adaptor subunit [Myxococcota bacterium]
MASAQAAVDGARAKVARQEQHQLDADGQVQRQAAQLVRAPRAGVVLRLHGGPGGGQVSAGDPLLTLVPEASARAVELWIDGGGLPLLDEGQQVRLLFEGWPALQVVGFPRRRPAPTRAASRSSTPPTTARAGSARWWCPIEAPAWPPAARLRQGSGEGLGAARPGAPRLRAVAAPALPAAAAGGRRGPAGLALGEEAAHGAEVMWLAWLTAALGAPLAPRRRARAGGRGSAVAAAEAALAGAEADLTGARGALDPTLSARGGAYGGKDPRHKAQVALTAPTIAGPTVSLGLAARPGQLPAVRRRRPPCRARRRAVGRGRGALLDGLLRSDRQLALREADADRAIAASSRDRVRIEARRRAAEAYWKWAAAGAQLAVDEALLAQAEARDAALARAVEEGTRPQLDRLDESQRVVLQRRDAVVRARLALESAALALSLWHRDATGRPTVPDSAQLPPLDTSAAVPDAPAGAAAARPDVAAARAALGGAQAGRARAANGLLPDLSVEARAMRPSTPTASRRSTSAAR